jgi:hypothetical protein
MLIAPYIFHVVPGSHSESTSFTIAEDGDYLVKPEDYVMRQSLHLSLCRENDLRVHEATAALHIYDKTTYCSQLH